MKLIELVQKYKGAVTFDVNNIVDDNSEDVVVFMADEVDAIKDEIVNAEVSKFSVIAFSGGVPTIKVLLKSADAAAADDTGGETTTTE